MFSIWEEEWCYKLLSVYKCLAVGMISVSVLMRQLKPWKVTCQDPTQGFATCFLHCFIMLALSKGGGCVSLVEAAHTCRH